MSNLLWLILIVVINLWGVIILVFVGSKFSDLNLRLRVNSYEQKSSTNKHYYKIRVVLKDGRKATAGVSNQIEIRDDELCINDVRMGFNQFEKIVIKQIDGGE